MSEFSDNILLIKNLPSSFSAAEKKSFLKCFDCQTVRILSSNGRLKNCAFASFADHRLAKSALHRLHQLKVLDSVLIAQYAKKQADAEVNEDEQDNEKSERLPTFQETCQCRRPLDQLTSQLEHKINPGHKYLYPEPNPDILMNICGALLTIPKFYTQVLHLMNKMSLYPPFSPAVLPPLLVEYFNKISPPVSFPPTRVDSVQSVGVESSASSSESELSSTESSGENFNILPRQGSVKSLKRKSNIISVHPHKKLRSLIKESSHVGHPADKDNFSIPAVFEDYAGKASQPKISLKTPASLVDSLPSKQKTPAPPDDDTNSGHTQSGFGKIKPPRIGQQSDETDENGDSFVTKIFTTSRQLEQGRLSRRELESHPLFKNYDEGAASSRLYVKNLHKKVSEKDLHHIFGYFVDVTNEEEMKMYDVRLMKRGRMKGQAFIGFPSVDVAKRALRLTNGFVLFEKPIVVTFARSANAQKPPLKLHAS